MASEQGESPIAREVMDYILASRTRASWWIDQRAMTNSIIALNYVLEHTHDEMQQAKAEAKPEAAEAKAEATVRPNPLLPKQWQRFVLPMSRLRFPSPSDEKISVRL